MNTKKVILGCVILIIAIFSLSMASAELFDNNDNDVHKSMFVNITDSQFNYELEEANIIKPGNDSFEKTGNYSKVKYKGYITLNLSSDTFASHNGTDDEIITIKDTLDNKSNILRLDTSLFEFDMECDDWNYTIENDTLTITFDTTFENPTHQDVNGSSSGTLNITGFELKNPSNGFYMNGQCR